MATTASSEERSAEPSSELATTPDQKQEKLGNGTAADEPAPLHNLFATSLSYNAFTLTDGALRLIILLHANALGFTPIEIAFMFSMYEVAGIFCNFFGGVAGSKFGLQIMLLSSLSLQIITLGALCPLEAIFGDLEQVESDERLEVTVYITAMLALSGIAKDLMKLTGKATPKLCTKVGQEGRLFRLVAWITGSKNTLKGIGQLLGAVLVAQIGFIWSLVLLAFLCAIFVPVGILYVDRGLGKGIKKKVDWHSVFHKGPNVNWLSAARFFLFASRDVWFEVPLPLFLKGPLNWKPELVGLAMAGYTIIYGILQASTTALYRGKGKKGSERKVSHPKSGSVPKAALWCSIIPAATGTLSYLSFSVFESNDWTGAVLAVGISAFAAVFAFNSAVHSYLIVSYSNRDKIAMELGFYYAANAGGRLIGTLLGGIVYQFTVDNFGLSMCLWLSVPFLVAAGLLGFFLVDPTPADAATREEEEESMMIVTGAGESSSAP